MSHCHSLLMGCLWRTRACIACFVFSWGHSTRLAAALPECRYETHAKAAAVGKLFAARVRRACAAEHVLHRPHTRQRYEDDCGWCLAEGFWWGSATHQSMSRRACLRRRRHSHVCCAVAMPAAVRVHHTAEPAQLPSWKAVIKQLEEVTKLQRGGGGTQVRGCRTHTCVRLPHRHALPCTAGHCRRQRTTRHPDHQAGLYQHPQEQAAAEARRRGSSWHAAHAVSRCIT
jgi:hypothetical protein